MILPNEIIIQQLYNVESCKCDKSKRIQIKPTISLTEITVTLFTMHQEDFRDISQKEKFKEPITIKYDGRRYRIFPYDIEYGGSKDPNISQVRIHGYVNQKEAPEFEIID